MGREDSISKRLAVRSRLRSRKLPVPPTRSSEKPRWAVRRIARAFATLAMAPRAKVRLVVNQLGCRMPCVWGSAPSTTDMLTRSGDFHAGMNFAAVLGGPMVFLCRNNGWAIVRRREFDLADIAVHAGRGAVYAAAC